jgi:hypothetical protein
MTATRPPSRKQPPLPTLESLSNVTPIHALFTITPASSPQKPISLSVTESSANCKASFAHPMVANLENGFDGSVRNGKLSAGDDRDGFFREHV